MTRITNKKMKKLILVGVMVFGLTVGVQTFAYEYVGGYRTLAAQDENGNDVVVIGGEVYKVVATPTNEAEKQAKISWLKAQIDSLSVQMNSLLKDKCAE